MMKANHSLLIIDYPAILAHRLCANATLDKMIVLTRHATDCISNGMFLAVRFTTYTAFNSGRLSADDAGPRC